MNNAEKHVIIIVAYHGDEWIPPCLESLFESSQIPLHVLLVDNAGNNQLWDGPTGIHTLEIIKTPRSMGFADANNFALAALPEHTWSVCFLNQDTISIQGWLDQCLEILKQHEDLCAITPLLRSYEDQGWDPTFVQILEQQEGYSPDWLTPSGEQGSSWTEVRQMPATAMIVKWAALHRSGPFDPVFGSYYEDFDLCMRLSRAGCRLAVCHDARIRHFSGSVSRTKEAQKRRARWVLRNRAIFRMRDGAPPRLAHFIRQIPVEWTLQLARCILRRPGSKPLSAILWAGWDLIGLLPRLLSAKVDQKHWRQYLLASNWPGALTDEES